MRGGDGPPCKLEIYEIRFLHVVCHIKNHTVNKGGGGVGFGPPCKIQIYEIRFTQ